jgi:hypothetical protein
MVTNSRRTKAGQKSHKSWTNVKLNNKVQDGTTVGHMTSGQQYGKTQDNKAQNIKTQDLKTTKQQDAI